MAGKTKESGGTGGMKENREILFRGKSVLSNEWIYGYYYFDGIHTILDKNLHTFAVGEETVGQYTGLKDKNGKKIFDGDILEIYGGDKNSCRYELVTIYYDIGNGIRVTYGQYEHNGHAPYWVKVVGNKTDNPELLEGKNETGKDLQSK